MKINIFSLSLVQKTKKSQQTGTGFRICSATDNHQDPECIARRIEREERERNTTAPTVAPTENTLPPTIQPTMSPTTDPTLAPTSPPTLSPTNAPTAA